MPRIPDKDDMPFYPDEDPDEDPGMIGIPEEDHPKNAGNPEAFAKKMFAQLGSLTEKMNPKTRWTQFTVTGTRRPFIGKYPGDPEAQEVPLDEFEDCKPHRFVMPAQNIASVRELSSGETEIEAMTLRHALRVRESLPTVLQYMGVKPNG